MRICVLSPGRAAIPTTSSCRGWRMPSCCARRWRMRISSASMQPRRGACLACCWWRPERTFGPTVSATCPAWCRSINRDGTPRHDTPRPVLALDKVRHVGQPVALVVAETLDRGARCRRSDRGRVRPAAGGDRGQGRDQRRRAAAVRPHSRQHRVRLGQRHGRRQGDRRRIRQSRARRHARARQQPRRCQLDGAAQRHCRLRSGERPLDALHRRRKVRISCAIRSPR